MFKIYAEVSILEEHGALIYEIETKNLTRPKQFSIIVYSKIFTGRIKMKNINHTKNIFWDVPGKYHTVCKDDASGAVIEERTLEAITRDEAQARAYLSCRLVSQGDSTLSVDVT